MKTKTTYSKTLNSKTKPSTTNLKSSPLHVKPTNPSHSSTTFLTASSSFGKQNFPIPYSKPVMTSNPPLNRSTHPSLKSTSSNMTPPTLLPAYHLNLCKYPSTPQKMPKPSSTVIPQSTTPSYAKKTNAFTSTSSPNIAQPAANTPTVKTTLPAQKSLSAQPAYPVTTAPNNLAAVQHAPPMAKATPLPQPVAPSTVITHVKNEQN